MRSCSKCHLEKSLERFSPKTLKSGLQGFQSECKDCRRDRERDRRKTITWKNKNAAYKLTDQAKARNLRAGQSDAGKASRKRYSQSEKGKSSAKRCRMRRASKAEIRIQNSMHEQLRRMMKSTWHESNLLSTMKTTRNKLMLHLEGLMLEGMSWDNYGYRDGDYSNGWDVDHIIPKSEYDHNDIEEREKCWNLANLRPMWHVKNISKGRKVIGVDCVCVDRELWPRQWNGVLPC